MKKASDILKIRDIIIYNSNVKSDIKIASVGDSHISKLVGQDDVDLISQSLYDENPNYICLLGDLIDSPEELEKYDKVEELKRLVKNSASIAPTLIVLGSHDFIDEHTENFDDVIDKTDVWTDINKISNVQILNDEVYQNNEIVIAGYRQKREVYYNLMKENKEDSQAYYDDFIKYENLYKNLPTDLPKILLTHSPEPIQDKINIDLLRDYDVILTGHYHNACVPAFLDNIWLPKNGGLITPRKNLLPKQARGVVELETGTCLIYSGGWVKLQDCAPKLIQPLDKLCNRQMDVTILSSDPEINGIEISNRKKVLKLR